MKHETDVSWSAKRRKKIEFELKSLSGRAKAHKTRNLKRTHQTEGLVNQSANAHVQRISAKEGCGVF